MLKRPYQFSMMKSIIDATNFHSDPKVNVINMIFFIYLKLAVLYLLCSIAFLSYIYSSSLPFFCYFLFFYLSLSLFLLGGEVFLFESKNSYKKSDWKADGHKWLNQGTTKLPRHQSTVGKSYYYLRTQTGTDKGFKKEVFILLNDDSRALVHYIGDETLSQPGAHGNSKKQTKLFFRTKPSVLTTLTEKTQTAVPSNRIYKEAVSEAPLHAITDVPRNLKQIQNLKEKNKQETRVSRDSINNLHELAYNSPGFIHQIFTYPDLVVGAGLDEMLGILDECLRSKSKQQLLSYDTTFSLGEFYVSPLLFCHIAFEGEPVMMAAVTIFRQVTFDLI